MENSIRSVGVASTLQPLTHLARVVSIRNSWTVELGICYRVLPARKIDRPPHPACPRFQRTPPYSSRETLRLDFVNEIWDSLVLGSSWVSSHWVPPQLSSILTPRLSIWGQVSAGQRAIATVESLADRPGCLRQGSWLYVRSVLTEERNNQNIKSQMDWFLCKCIDVPEKCI